MKQKNNKNAEIEDLPRPGTPLYNFVHEDPEIRKKTLKKWKRLNKYLVLPLYRIRLLPLVGFGRIFLVLTTKGRISGKKRRTPLEYHWIDGVMTVFSGRGDDAGWVKNVRSNPDSVWVRHGFHSFHARVEFVSDEEAKLNTVKWYVTKHSRSAKMLFGWNPEIDDPETMDFSRLLGLIGIIRLYRYSESD
jgi:deazaflavin-dependent oxidoreductase (nitroreductase family)